LSSIIKEEIKTSAAQDTYKNTIHRRKINATMEIWERINLTK
jgi:hypothetical protein